MGQRWNFTWIFSSSSKFWSQGQKGVVQIRRIPQKSEAKEEEEREEKGDDGGGSNISCIAVCSKSNLLALCDENKQVKSSRFSSLCISYARSPCGSFLRPNCWAQGHFSVKLQELSLLTIPSNNLTIDVHNCDSGAVSGGFWWLTKVAMSTSFPLRERKKASFCWVKFKHFLDILHSRR